MPAAIAQSDDSAEVVTAIMASPLAKYIADPKMFVYYRQILSESKLSIKTMITLHKLLLGHVTLVKFQDS